MYHSNDECGLFIIYSVCCLHLPPTVCSIILPPFRLSKPSVSIFNILFSPLHIIWPFLCRHEKTHCFVAGHMNTIHYFTAHTFKIIKNIIKLSVYLYFNTELLNWTPQSFNFHSNCSNLLQSKDIHLYVKSSA